MTGKKKVIVGLSGGVDSSVAAYLLKQQGYDVTGVTMSIWDGKPSLVPSGKHACYGPDENEEIEEARELAGILDIPYRVFDCSQRYKTLVLDYFRQEYLSGRTPNPLREMQPADQIRDASGYGKNGRAGVRLFCHRSLCNCRMG